MNPNYITIDVTEVATKLADDETYDHFMERLREDVYNREEDPDSLTYKEEAQEYFDVKYQYYLDVLNLFKKFED